MTVTPPEPIEDTKVWPLLMQMVDCLCAELAASPGGTPCYCGVVPGQVPSMDFCDCLDASACGMGWVRLDTAYPSTVFPQQQTAARNCRTPLALSIQVGVTRCVPGLDAAGNPPDAVEQAEAVRIQMGDMLAARRAIVCCLGDHPAHMLGRYTPLGPLGNCAGGFWVASVQVM